MENSGKCPAAKDGHSRTAEANEANNWSISSVSEDENNAFLNQSDRTPFTDLNQVDADLALARTLQEQERAFLMLRLSTERNGWEFESYSDETGEEYNDLGDDFVIDADDFNETNVDQEDADGIVVEDLEQFELQANVDTPEGNSTAAECDTSVLPIDETYARVLQEVEEQEADERALTFVGESGFVDGMEELSHNLQDTWVEVNPDELSYEELLALGEVVGSHNRGLPSEDISSLPSKTYKAGAVNEDHDMCVICQIDCMEGDTVSSLACKHIFHSACITQWLQINKTCPFCKVEASPEGSQEN